MAYGDGSGPNGAGAMTGRAAGFCAGFNVPGYANPVGAGAGRGFGCGTGRRGGGGGRGGRGQGFGVRNSYGVINRNFVAAPQFDNRSAAGNIDAEKNYLKNEAEILKQSLASITERLGKLESEKTES